MIKNKGFTLIELMVTVAILGVVASIAIPAYTGYLKTARETEAKNNIAAFILAQEEYFLEENDYFAGANVTQLNTNSNGLWSVSPGADGNVNFTYATSGVTSTTYGIIATGKANTPVAGVVIPYSKP